MTNLGGKNEGYGEIEGKKFWSYWCRFGTQAHWINCFILCVSLSVCLFVCLLYGLIIHVMPRHQVRSLKRKTNHFSLPCIGGSRGRAQQRPLEVQILSFWHTKFSKCNHLGSPRPPPREGDAPTGNPAVVWGWDGNWW